MSEMIHLQIEADKLDLTFGGVKLNDASKIVELVKENNRLKDEINDLKKYASRIKHLADFKSYDDKKELCNRLNDIYVKVCSMERTFNRIDYIGTKGGKA